MKTFKDALIDKAKIAQRESKYIEFKETFDVTATQDWCEIIKDIVAIANSGGGIIIFGAKSDGTHTDFDGSEILKVDMAIVTDKINRYTNTAFQAFEIIEVIRNNKKLVAVIIDGIRIPMVFSKPGTYPVADGKQKTAFSQGTLYYRHGAKSEPCNSDDLKEVIDRNLEQIKTSWLSNIRKVVTAPVGANVQVLPENVVLTTNSAAMPIRLTDDISAPAFHLTNPDEIFKYRMTLLVKEINKKLDGVQISGFDIRCVCWKYGIYKNEKFVYFPLYSSTQYSEAFAEWIIEQHQKDNEFFKIARQEYSETHERRKKRLFVIG